MPELHREVMIWKTRYESPDPYLPKNPCPLDRFPPTLRSPLRGLLVTTLLLSPHATFHSATPLGLRSSRIALLKKCWSERDMPQEGTIQGEVRDSTHSGRLCAVQRFLPLKVLVTS